METDIRESGEPFENLAYAIIMQAVADYRKYMEKIKAGKNVNDSVSEIQSIERFFRSEWYDALSPVDGEYLIEQLRKETIQNISAKEYKRLFSGGIA